MRKFIFILACYLASTSVAFAVPVTLDFTTGTGNELLPWSEDGFTVVDTKTVSGLVFIDGAGTILSLEQGGSFPFSPTIPIGSLSARVTEDDATTFDLLSLQVFSQGTRFKVVASNGNEQVLSNGIVAFGAGFAGISWFDITNAVAGSDFNLNMDNVVLETSGTTTVPEPASLSLLLLALAGLGVGRSRRHRNARVAALV